MAGEEQQWRTWSVFIKPPTMLKVPQSFYLDRYLTVYLVGLKNVEPGFKPDVYFQQCLPDYFEPFNGKNIGFAFTETRNLQYTGWVEKFNDMDEVWVATQQEKTNLIKSGVNKKILVIPMPMELKVGNHIPYFKENIGDKVRLLLCGRDESVKILRR